MENKKKKMSKCASNEEKAQLTTLSNFLQTAHGRRFDTESLWQWLQKEGYPDIGAIFVVMKGIADDPEKLKIMQQMIPSKFWSRERSLRRLYEDFMIVKKEEKGTEYVMENLIQTRLNCVRETSLLSPDWGIDKQTYTLKEIFIKNTDSPRIRAEVIAQTKNILNNHIRYLKASGIDKEVIRKACQTAKEKMIKDSGQELADMIFPPDELFPAPKPGHDVD